MFYKKLSLVIFILTTCLSGLENFIVTENADAHPARIREYSRWELKACSTHNYKDWSTIRLV